VGHDIQEGMACCSANGWTLPLFTHVRAGEHGNIALALATSLFLAYADGFRARCHVASRAQKGVALLLNCKRAALWSLSLLLCHESMTRYCSTRGVTLHKGAAYAPGLLHLEQARGGEASAPLHFHTHLSADILLFISLQNMTPNNTT